MESASSLYDWKEEFDIDSYTCVDCLALGHLLGLIAGRVTLGSRGPVLV